MSRICVKNIGKNAKEEDLRQMFASRGEVTDVKVIKTKDGKSRGFAFVGFRSDEQAKEAMKYFNNTYIGLSRISIEVAKKLEHHESDNTSPAGSKKNVKDKLQQLKKELQELKDPHKVKENIKEAQPGQVMSKKKAEFLAVATSHKSDILPPTPTSNTPKASIKQQSNSDDSDSDTNSSDGSSAQSLAEDDEHDSDDNNKAALDSMSDMEYLRSKMKTKTPDSSDPVDDNGGDMEGAEELGQNAEGDAEEGKAEEKTEYDDSRIYIRNLPYSTSEDELRAHFEAFGSVSEVHIPLGKDKKPTGMGY
eukprot:gene45866-56136_t